VRWWLAGAMAKILDDERHVDLYQAAARELRAVLCQLSWRNAARRVCWMPRDQLETILRANQPRWTSNPWRRCVGSVLATVSETCGVLVACHDEMSRYV
jgi:hypothetical protein